MGQILHRGATTTEAVRRAIQHSQESLRTLARRHGITGNIRPLAFPRLSGLLPICCAATTSSLDTQGHPALHRAAPHGLRAGGDQKGRPDRVRRPTQCRDQP